MKVSQMHPWDLSPSEARGIQRQLASLVSHQDHLVGTAQYVAGMDVSPPNTHGVVRGAVVVLAYPELEVVDYSVAERKPGFPYIPGLLSFREAPVLIDALEKLQIEPDLLMLDAHGYAHPRRFGLASHIGVLTDVPTLGCAKSLLVGSNGELASHAGSYAPIVHGGEQIGMAVRTRQGVRPVYVSVGHKVDLSSAVRWVLQCCRGYRLPQTTRLAHVLAGGGTLPPAT